MLQTLVTAQSVDKIGETIRELFIVLKDPTEVAGCVISIAFILELLGYDVPYFPGPAIIGEIVDSFNATKKAREEQKEGETFFGTPTTSDPEGITTPLEAYQSAGGGALGTGGAIGAALYNLLNPNWGIGDPDAAGVTESLQDIWGEVFG